MSSRVSKALEDYRGPAVEEEKERPDFDSQLERFLVELDAWQGELRLDVSRAELRGLTQLASDLRRLNGRVDRVLSAGRELAR